MSQDHVVMLLLRHINGALPAEGVPLPEELSGLSAAQIHLLAELYELEKRGNGPPTLSALARETGFSKAAVCATLKGLRKAGYVQMQTDDRDNRRKAILLTLRARQSRSCVTQAVARLEEALCAGVSPKDLQATERSLGVILQNARQMKAKRLYEISHAKEATQQI